MKIEKVMVIGAGTMGSGIAQTALQSGYEVALCDTYEPQLPKAEAGITKGLAKRVKLVKVGNYLNKVSAAIQDYVESNGYGVVRDYVGHGIGCDMHEDPEIPNYRTGRPGPRLVKGMTLAIEPMVTVGTYKVHTLPNKWTVVTNDGGDAAHYENTVLVTDSEPEILTLV